MRKLLLAIASTLCISANAQDVHFSQYFSSPLTLNPANTGLISGDWRLAANYRQQWASINNVPYTTATVSYDMAVMKGKLNGDALGIGVIALYDKAGTGALTNTTAGISLAYHKVFGDAEDKPSVLSIGGQGFLVQKSLDQSKLIWEADYDPATGTLVGAGGGENFVSGDMTYPSVNAGLMYTSYLNEKSTYYLGAAMYHINRPEERFLQTSGKRISTRYAFTGGANLQMNEKSMLMASVLYQQQGPASELVLGAATGFIMNPLHDEFTKSTIFYLGAWYRFADAVVPYVGFEWGRSKLGVNYDINLSNLTVATQGKGALEVSYVLNGIITRMETKKYNFACPRF